MITFSSFKDSERTHDFTIKLKTVNRPKETDKPTTERLLKAFSGITLTIINAGGKTIRHLTPLSELQKEILKRLDLDISLYLNLEN